MRAFEVALFVACVVAATVFLPALLTGTSLGTPYTDSGGSIIGSAGVGTLSNLTALPTRPSPVDYFFLMVNLIILALLWFFQMIMSLILLAPWLESQFHFPAFLAYPIEIALWFLIVIAAVQMWRAVSTDSMR